MRVDAGLLLLLLVLPALAIGGRAGASGRERGGRGRGGRGGKGKDRKDKNLEGGTATKVEEEVDDGEKCDDRAHLSLTERTQSAQVVFYGFVTRLYKEEGRSSYPAEFFIVNIFKGADIVAKILGVDPGYGGVYNLRDKRINVTNFGPREACLAPLEEQRTFIILANTKNGRRLRGHYDHSGSAAVQWTKENEEEVWRALGK
ncbi:uncharacterized protein LOC119590092 [Penaeus monodon]|uniref:uncharacterized protein LOC119590092 n=1 Tax=Penaeus monodon TaxID=6687 RepID=UPI0018A7A9C7|nr:uncharacterized protein LOC119590092 [Penaeus monodon]